MQQQTHHHHNTTRTLTPSFIAAGAHTTTTHYVAAAIYTTTATSYSSHCHQHHQNLPMHYHHSHRQFIATPFLSATSPPHISPMPLSPPPTPQSLREKLPCHSNSPNLKYSLKFSCETFSNLVINTPPPSEIPRFQTVSSKILPRSLSNQHYIRTNVQIYRLFVIIQNK
jgi:hypothetical protein